MSLLTNLSAFWNLDGNSNDNFSTNNGTDTNITYSLANGKIFQGAGFNGTTSYIQVPDAVSLRYLSGNISISIWYKPTNTTGVQTLIGKWANDSGTGSDWIIYQNGTSIVGTVNPGTSTVSSASLTAGNWHHIVYTVNSSKSQNLYVNGSLVSGPVTDGAGDAAVNDPVRMGQNTGTNFINGKLDMVGVWSRVLSSTEVTELYNSGNGLPYPFTKGGFLSFM